MEKRRKIITRPRITSRKSFRKELQTYYRKKIEAEVKKKQKQYDDHKKSWLKHENYSYFDRSEETYIKYYGKRPTKEDVDIIRKVLSRQQTSLQTFYKNFFGTEPNLSKKPLVDFLVDRYSGNTPDYIKRKKEMKNIDEKYISSSTGFFTLNGICISRDVILEILSFLDYDFDLLTTVGTVNSSFYLLILTSWNSTVPISHDSLFKISSLILKSMKNFYIGPGLRTEEFTYLLDKITPRRILEIQFNRCQQRDLLFFLKSLKSKNIIFSACQSIHCSLPISKKKKATKKIVFSHSHFPELKFVDHAQVNEHMDLSQNKKMDQLVIGNKLYPAKSFKFQIFEFKDIVRRRTFKNIKEFRTRGQKQSSLISISSQQILERLPDKGTKIRHFRFRVKRFTDYHNLCKIITCPGLVIHKLELDVGDGDVSTWSRSRKEAFLWNGKDGRPEVFFFPKMTELKELRLYQLRIGPEKQEKGSYGSNQTHGLFGFSTRLSGRVQPNLKIVKFRNVPISVCDSVFDCYLNLEVFEIAFLGLGKDQNSYHILQHPQEKLKAFFVRFVEYELKRRFFRWNDYFLFEEKKVFGEYLRKSTSQKKNPYGKVRGEGKHKATGISNIRWNRSMNWDAVMKIFRDAVKMKNEVKK